MRLLIALLVSLLAVSLWDLGWWLLYRVRPLGPLGLRRRLRRNPPPIVLDVRTPAEFETFHIPGALNVAYPATLRQLKAALPDPSRPVAVVCMTGHRSPPVVRQLQQGGYADVRNVTWGMTAWKLFGGDTVTGR